MKIYKVKTKLLTLFLTIIMLVSATGFNTKNSSNIDEKILKDDFYTAVNKEWLKNAKIKNGDSIVSSFTQAEDKLKENKFAVINDLIKNKNNFKENSNEKKLIDFYDSISNMEKRNNQGIKPIEKYLNKVKSVKTTNDLTALFSDPKLSLFNTLYSFEIAEEYDKPYNNVLYIFPLRFHIGSHADYITPDDSSKLYLKERKDYLEKILILSGYTKKEAIKKLENITNFEKTLASTLVSTNEIDFKDDYDYHLTPYTLKEIKSLAPSLNLDSILKSLGYDKSDKILLSGTKWLKKLNDLYTNENLQMFKDYFELSIIDASSEYLTSEFEKAYNDYQHSLIPSTPTSREENALYKTQEVFEDLYAHIYYKKYITQRDKDEVERIGKDILTSYKSLIQNANFINQKSRDSITKKLNKVSIKLDYPEVVKDYTALEISSYENGGNLLENILSYREFSRKALIDKLNKPSNNELYYSLLFTTYLIQDSFSSTIYIPYGLLQDPFYSINKSREENLGGLGMLIAREITNNFNIFDIEESLKLLTPKDAANIKEKLTNVNKHYKKIKYSKDNTIDSNASLIENMIDITAFTSTLNALDKLENPNYNSFFTSFATSLRDKETEKSEIDKIKYGPRLPSKLSANALVQQSDKFYETYNIKQGDKMYIVPSDRLKVW